LTPLGDGNGIWPVKDPEQVEEETKENQLTMFTWKMSTEMEQKFCYGQREK